MEGNTDREDDKLIEGIKICDKELKKMIRKDKWDDSPLVYGELDKPR